MALLASAWITASAQEEAPFAQTQAGISFDAGQAELYAAHNAAAKPKLADPVELPAQMTPTGRTDAGTRGTGPAARSVASASDLAGEYLLIYTSLQTSYYDYLDEPTISAIAGTDSVAIAGFWNDTITIKAHIDLSAMTITIPNQIVGTHSTYGDMDLAYCTSTGAPDRTQPVTGTIAADGSITIDDWWGIYPASSTTLTFGLYGDTRMGKVNGTMTHTIYDPNTLTTTQTSSKISISQTSAKYIEVLNFGGFGKVVKISLRRDSTATISSQHALSNSTSYWYTYRCTYSDDMSRINTYSYVIYCDQAADARTISWTNWTMISMSGTYIYAFFTDACITANFDITYPTAGNVAFDGSGTEGSPYLIKTTDDLVALADEVNYSTDYSLDSDSAKAISYLGTYFRLENDLDMTGVEMDPIGFDGTHCFAGTFDGNSKTISGLTIGTDYLGYAGLFGRCYSTSAIKNLTLDEPSVSTTAYYAGAIAAYSTGSIDNCHISGGTVSNTGYSYAGGIAGIVYNVTGCTVTGTAIDGYYGYAGGIAGAVYSGEITNCGVTGATINTKNGSTSTTYPAGGVVGYLYQSNATLCYFSGTISQVDVDSEQYSMYIGGIAGNCRNSTISRCFSTGTVDGAYSSAGCLGGIVGYLAGWVDNCYSSLSISGYTTASTSGGIAGYMVYWYDSDKVVKVNTIENCWWASDKSSVYSNSAPNAQFSFTNNYFDRQMAGLATTDTIGSYTSDMTSASGLNGFSSEIWTFTEGYYPRLKDIDGNEAAYLSASALIMTKSNSLARVTTDATLSLLGSTTAAITGSCSSISGSTLSVSASSGVDTLYFNNSTAGSRYMILNIAPVSFDGSGTEDDPYLIKTKDDLIELSTATTTSGQVFTGTYFKMTNDIDMELDESFIGICADASTSSNRFAGTFDGGGYTIHNLKMPSSVTWNVEPDTINGTLGTPNSSKSVKYRSFIGRLESTGVLKNLTMAADCDFSLMWNYCGGLVAVNRGTIDNCRNYADVTCYGSYAGGITYQNYSTGVISNCCNEGNITVGSTTVGGIAASNNGLIQNCQNCGDISAQILSEYMTDDTKLYYVGGIAGTISGGRIENCVNAGAVSGYYSVSCLVGTSATGGSGTYSNEVEYCVNYGQLFPGDLENCGIVSRGSLGVAAGIYYDAQITLYGAWRNTDLDGATGVTTSALTSGTELSGFSTDLWDFTQGQYPVLKQFADEPKSKIARRVIASIDEAQTVADICGAVELSSDDGCTWSLADGSNFVITGNKLYPPATVESTVSDTLTATAGTFTKQIVIQAATSSGVEAVVSQTPCGELLDERYYTADGRLVEEPSGNRAIYIVVRTYDDGTTTATKEVW